MNGDVSRRARPPEDHPASQLTALRRFEQLENGFAIEVWRVVLS
jgi:hypothetical protein